MSITNSASRVTKIELKFNSLITKSAKEIIPLFLNLINDLVELHLRDTSVILMVSSSRLLKITKSSYHGRDWRENLLYGEHFPNPLTHKAKSSCKTLYAKSFSYLFKRQSHKPVKHTQTVRGKRRWIVWVCLTSLWGWCLKG